jgi:hypothetical protein
MGVLLLSVTKYIFFVPLRSVVKSEILPQKELSMKSIRIFFGAVLLVVLPAVVLGQSLQLLDSSLFYQTTDYRPGDKKILVKKLTYDTDFYGYDLIDNTHVFLAYQRQDAPEGRAVLAIYDVEKEKEKIIDEVKATRTSSFLYNRENGTVLFNGLDGIYMLRVKGFLAGLLAKPRLVLSGTDFYKIFWVNAKKFGYNEFDEKTRQVSTKYQTLSD